MQPPNESTDTMDEPPTGRPDDPTTPESDDSTTTDHDHPNGRSIPRTSDSRTADQPFCRVFGGPTSHRVQFAGPESRPATAIDRVPNERASTDDPQTDDPQSDDPQTDDPDADSVQRATEILLGKLAALQRALEPIRGACRCGRSPNPADVREARAKMLDLRIAVEEHFARACPDAEPWELSAEQVPGPRLVGMREASEEIQQLLLERGDQDESN